MSAIVDFSKIIRDSESTAQSVRNLESKMGSYGPYNSMRDQVDRIEQMLNNITHFMGEEFAKLRNENAKLLKQVGELKDEVLSMQGDSNES